MRNIAPFDREASFFEGQQTPQIQVKLNLVCETSAAAALSSQNTSALPLALAATTESLVTDEIMYSRSVSYLNIIIIDQNDNSPYFTQPAMDNFKIGSLDADLTERLMPHHLIQVEAFDLDEGINAKVKFSLASSEHFIIDPESGDIYPSKHSMSNIDDITLVVRATDRDGAGDGRFTETFLKVMKITSGNVVVLVAEDFALTDVDNIIDNISVASEADFRVINYFSVPSTDDAEAKQQSPETELVIYVYAFGSDNALMTSDEIVLLLTGAEVGGIRTVTPIEAPPRQSSDCNFTGLIVAVSLLGSILLITSITIPLIWFLWLRYKINGTERRGSESSVKKLEDEFGHDMMGESSPPTVTVEGSEASFRSDAEIIGIEIAGATEGEFSD